MKKELKKSKTAFTATEVGVLIEGLRSQFRVFGEKLKTLEDKIDTTMGMVAKNTEDITFLKITGEGSKYELTKINGKLAQIESRLAKVEEDMGVFRSDFGKRLTALEVSLK